MEDCGPGAGCCRDRNLDSAVILALNVIVNLQPRGQHATSLPRRPRGATSSRALRRSITAARCDRTRRESTHRSEEHTSELQSLMRISYAVFCLKKKNKTKQNKPTQRNIV